MGAKKIDQDYQDAINPSEVHLYVSGPQEEILYSTSHFNLFQAGVGSGKTHLFGYLSADFIINYPELTGFIGTNTYDQLNKSTLRRIFEVWESTFGWTEGIEYVVDKQPPDHFRRFGAKLKSYKNTISFNNGCLIFVSSLENYKIIDGAEFGWALLDETKDTREEAVKEVIIQRLRQAGMWVFDGEVYDRSERDEMIQKKKWVIKNIDGEDRTVDKKTGKMVNGWNPLYIATSPAKVRWLNEWFGLTEEHEAEISAKVFTKDQYYHYADEEKCVVISSTYHNEHNLPEGYIQRQIDALAGNQGLIDMMIWGYPFGKSGGEWVHAFDRTQHVKRNEPTKDLPMHISLDFNVVPYMTLIVIQLEEVDERWKVKVVGEICSEHPKNNTPDICATFAYEYAGMINGLYYYGDPSGKNRNTVSAEVRDNYEALENVLHSYLNNYSDRVSSSHASLTKVRDFINRCFNGYYPLDIEIDPSCTNLIHDIDISKEDNNGGFKKEKVKNKETGESYEKNGHCLDAFKDFMVAAFPDYFEEVA